MYDERGSMLLFSNFQKNLGHGLIQSVLSSTRPCPGLTGLLLCHVGPLSVKNNGYFGALTT